ncbi:MAG: PilZ domain-containing protein [Elusimicrobia bacterium]|nr:PilZ domain-containing protein [Elusimicrobiota bacterium]
MKPAMEKKDTRRHPRIPYTIVFDLYANRESLHSRGKACIVNLSEKGAGLESEVPLQKGQPVFFRLNVPVDVEAEVVHSKVDGKRYRYGIRFKKINLFDRWRIRRFIRKHIK